jgi:hypothetical protein
MSAGSPEEMRGTIGEGGMRVEGGDIAIQRTSSPAAD